MVHTKTRKHSCLKYRQQPALLAPSTSAAREWYLNERYTFSRNGQDGTVIQIPRVSETHLIFPRHGHGRRRSCARQVKVLIFPRVRHWFPLATLWLPRYSSLVQNLNTNVRPPTIQLRPCSRTYVFSSSRAAANPQGSRFRVLAPAIGRRTNSHGAWWCRKVKAPPRAAPYLAEIDRKKQFADSESKGEEPLLLFLKVGSITVSENKEQNAVVATKASFLGRICLPWGGGTNHTIIHEIPLICLFKTKTCSAILLCTDYRRVRRPRIGERVSVQCPHLFYRKCSILPRFRRSVEMFPTPRGVH